MKTKQDKYLNHICKILNRQLRHDVFQGRFTIRQIKKNGFEDDHSLHWYIMELCDKKDPSRNQIFCLTNWYGKSMMYEVYSKMNKFITESDFWSTFNYDEWNSKYMICSHCDEYRPFKTKRERVEYVVYKDNKPLKISMIANVNYCKECGSKMMVFKHKTELKNKIEELIGEFSWFPEVGYEDKTR